MASGDLTATRVFTGDIAGNGIISAIDAANLAAATDTIHIVSAPGRDQQVVVFKVEREAD